MHHLQPSPRRQFWVTLGLLLLGSLRADQPPASPAPEQTQASAPLRLAGAAANKLATGAAVLQDTAQDALARFVDRLPDLQDAGVPNFAPRGEIRFYAHPKFGDLIHEDYFRLPVGARAKLSEDVEINAELGSYFTHGLGDSVGNGLYRLLLGAQHQVFTSPEVAWSVGAQWITPLDHPPHGISDNLRHTLPGITVTKNLDASCGLVGFATFGADLISYTSLPPDFRINQLRDDALFLTVGIARAWRKLHLIMRVVEGNTGLLSDTDQNVFALRPALGIPLLRRRDKTPRATLTFEGRTVWGPDGFEKGINTSLRVDFRVRRGRD